MVDAAIGKGAEISSLRDIEHAAEQQEGRSEAASTKSQIRNPKVGEEVAGPTSCVPEISAQNDAVRSAERDERVAMESASLAEGARSLEAQGTRAVTGVARVGARVATNGMVMSNKERKRRRREDRKRIREWSVVSGPLSVV